MYFSKPLIEANFPLNLNFLMYQKENVCCYTFIMVHILYIEPLVVVLVLLIGIYMNYTKHMNFHRTSWDNNTGKLHFTPLKYSPCAL